MNVTSGATFRADQAAVARLLTRIEAEDPRALGQAFAAERKRGSGTHVIGITGAPGVGKSTLVAAMIDALRRRSRTVAVVAVDPSSSHSGGAVLGDRVRMLRSQSDPSVFVRSMASRGQFGGLSVATPSAVAALAGAGFDVVIVETVGVGQSETEVARLVDSTVVVLAPGMGDAVQTVKAGVLEEADVFVVNKADYGGAGQTAAQLNAMLDAGAPTRAGSWRPPVLRAVALRAEGTEALLDALDDHTAVLDRTGHSMQRRSERLQRVVRDLAVRCLLDALDEPGSPQRDLLDRCAGSVADGELTPSDAAETVLRSFHP